MKVAVYGLTRDDGRRVAGRGISGERLRVVRLGTIAAVVGDIARTPSPTEARLRAYLSVVAALAARYPAILPVRFGTLMEDDTELQTILRAREKNIRSQLSRVRGRVQMTVRIVVPVRGVRLQADHGPAKAGHDVPEKSSGSEYLLARAREQRASSIPGFAPLSRAVARWVKDERVDRRGDVVTVYHLIPAAAADRYANAMEEAAAATGIRVMVSGPWPAHAFADSW